MNRIYLLVGLLVINLLLTNTVYAIDFTETGPLRIRDQFLLNLGLLAFEPDAASVLEPGKSRMELIETVSNTFAMSSSMRSVLGQRDAREPVTLADLRAVPGNNFYLDAEVYRTALSFDRAMTEDLQIGVTLQWVSFTGGFLDGLIEGFHNTFGIGQGGRKGVSRGKYTVYTRSNGVEIFDNNSIGIGMSDIVLRTKAKLFWTRHKSLVSVQSSVKIPLGDGDDLFSSGSLDVGIQLLGSYYPSRTFCIHYALGILRLGKWERFDLPSQTTLSGMVGFELGITPTSSVITQLTVSQSPFSDLNLPELSEFSLQGSFGYKHEFDHSIVLFGAITENLIHFDNTADIGFHLGISRAF